MNTEQIVFLCRNIPDLKEKFLGAFPSDKLPVRRRIKGEKFCIANIDPSYRDGSHWVAIIFRPKKKDIYFDSYGQQPNDTFKRGLKPNFSFNNVQLQHPLSTSCGQWCIFFCCSFFTDHSLCKIKNFFSKNSNLLKNDYLVNKFVNDLFDFDDNYEVIDMEFVQNQFSRKMKDVL